MTNWTPAQQAAIEDRGGGLLVSAAAGSGKTAVLTERAVRLIADPTHPIPADKLLIVTFTNAAAAELRARIGESLLRRSQADPASGWLRRQQMLLQRTPICTIDAFCLDLLRRHFEALDIPPDFAPADAGSVQALREAGYEVVLAAQGDNAASDTLTLYLDVDQLEVSQGDFSSEYPEQEGSADTSFSFNATLINNSAAEQSYSLSANAPDGWQVAFKPSGESTQVASLSLEPAVSQGLTITVTPPNNVEAGEYTIPCSAISADESLNMELLVKVTESYDITLSTPDGLLSFDTTAGKEKDLTLTVTNNSNVAVEHVNLTASAPTDWNVSFDTPTIDVVEAGATVEVSAHVTPSSEALTGDYVVTFTADASAVSDSAEFRVAVETSVLWGFAAILIIAALLAGIGYVFRKYGRR